MPAAAGQSIYFWTKKIRQLECYYFNALIRKPAGDV